MRCFVATPWVVAKLVILWLAAVFEVVRARTVRDACQRTCIPAVDHQQCLAAATQGVLQQSSQLHGAHNRRWLVYMLILCVLLLLVTAADDSGKLHVRCFQLAADMTSTVCLAAQPLLHLVLWALPCCSCRAHGCCAAAGLTPRHQAR